MALLARKKLTDLVSKTLNRNPAVALLGPRQCGKTTLARMLCATTNTRHHFFDLENPEDLGRFEAPMQALAPLHGLVVIDEIQRKPDLFQLLRVLIDKPDNRAKYLLLGSASLDLVKGVSESLAGRIGFVDMSGFDLDETGAQGLQQLWNRGGFPRSYLAADAESSHQWRLDFIRTFLERDLPQLGIRTPAQVLRRFWTMLAHYHGQVWNAAEFARSLGLSQPTVRHYLDLLSGAYVVRILQPWHENLAKRQIKSPKIYVRDSGLLHTLLSIPSHYDLQAHPKLGASWEGFVLEQIIAASHARDLYFWATHAGAELDILVMRHGQRLGIEIKYADAPAATRSLRVAIRDLGLAQACIVYPGTTEYRIDDRIRVVPLAQALQLFAAD